MLFNGYNDTHVNCSKRSHYVVATKIFNTQFLDTGILWNDSLISERVSWVGIVRPYPDDFVNNAQLAALKWINHLEIFSLANWNGIMKRAESKRSQTSLSGENERTFSLETEAFTVNVNSKHKQALQQWNCSLYTEKETSTTINCHRQTKGNEKLLEGGGERMDNNVTCLSIIIDFMNILVYRPTTINVCNTIPRTCLYLRIHFALDLVCILLFFIRTSYFTPISGIIKKFTMVFNFT